MGFFSCRNAVEPTNTVKGGGVGILVWEKLPALSGKSFYTLSSSGTLLAGSDSGRIFRSTNSGRDWQQVSVGTGTFRSIIREIHNLVFAANDSTGIYRSDDDGLTWQRKISGLTDTAIITIAPTVMGRLIAGSKSGDVYLSADNGETWTQRYTIARPITACLESSTSVIFFSAWDDGMYRFRENNLVPTAINTGLSNKFITSIAINRSGHLFLGSLGSAIFRSTNGGDEWVHFESGMPNANVSSIAVNVNDQIFAGTNDGIFTSRNNGLAWTRIDSSLTSRNVLSLSLDATGYLFAGTADGVFRSTQSTTVIYPYPTSTTSQ